MSDTITLRRLSPDDLETLLAVRHGLFDNAVLPEQAKAFLADPLHEIMLAFDGAEAVGMATGKIMLHPDKQPAFFIAEVGVRDEYQRQGIAKRLFDALMQHARDRGCKGIWLATEADNLPARALYRSLDARETGGIVVYDWDGAMDG
ncbi:Ribosomal protein S18 acetylase RimI [Roseivivax lentus]|uniref:Ribosomal protein S18 acetylase RimI n=1 Tax=Roseivivax lentus TaxID=633194 RepID=A0A1N7KXN3_9RHOB|nr:GNAT family N-acetyltransferase [Roseivivax lentus]SIS66180.1 Ribosomal protein S18 acetylase RimI [Roseivivax lentus]